jgi:hypothetical protein
MAMSPTDRNLNYMKETWGTNKLITDYERDAKVLQEVLYDPANKVKLDKEELFEEVDENEFEYGIEPSFKLKRGQRVL